MCLMWANVPFSPAQVSSPAPAAKYPPAREVSRRSARCTPFSASIRSPENSNRRTPLLQKRRCRLKPPTREPSRRRRARPLRGRGRRSFQRRITPARHSDAGGRIGRASSGNTRIGDTTIDDLCAEVTKAINSGDDQALQTALGKVTGNLGKGALAFPGAISPGSDVGVFSLSTRDRARGPVLRVGGTSPASADGSRPAA